MPKRLVVLQKIKVPPWNSFHTQTGYYELVAIFQLLSKANDHYQQEFKHLLKRVDEFEEWLNLNSKNSSKPPSSDQKRNKSPSK